MVRRAVKLVIHAVFAIFVSPFVLLAALERLWRGDAFFLFGGQALALMPGLPGVYARAAFLWATTARTSWEIHVGFGSVCMHRQVRIAARASMGAYCVIGHADIGEQVMMGSRVSIPSGKRQHLDEQGQLNHDVAQFDTVKIGRDSWIGEGAIVMAAVGARCIVSSGSVVVHDAPAQVLVAGNPARVIKNLGNPPVTTDQP